MALEDHFELRIYRKKTLNKKSLKCYSKFIIFPNKKNHLHSKKLNKKKGQYILKSYLVKNIQDTLVT